MIYIEYIDISNANTTIMRCEAEVIPRINEHVTVSSSNKIWRVFGVDYNYYDTEREDIIPQYNIISYITIFVEEKGEK